MVVFSSADAEIEDVVVTDADRAATLARGGVEAAAAQIARMVAAADAAFAHRVSDTAEALESLGTATSEHVTDA